MRPRRRRRTITLVPLLVLAGAMAAAEEVNVLPGSNNVLTAMQYVPGVQGNWESASLGAVIHGSDGPDSQPHVDGIKSGMQLGSRNSYVGGIGLLTDEGTVEELVFDVSSQSAEYSSSGVRSNLIPKSGGNDFSGGVFAGGATERFIDHVVGTGFGRVSAEAGGGIRRGLRPADRDPGRPPTVVRHAVAVLSSAADRPPASRAGGRAPVG